jgi:hypothetical protein
MLNETVRAQTFPHDLSLQLLLGHALEIVFLLDGNCAIDESDRSVLRRTADRLSLGPADGGMLQLSAFSTESIDVLAAAEAAFEALDLSALRDQLEKLASSLRHLADGEENRVDLDKVIEALTALRTVLLGRTSISPDEAREMREAV